MKNLTMLSMAMFLMVRSVQGHAQDLGSLLKETEAPINGIVSDVLADSFAKTLYVFDLDTIDKTACSGECSEKWPPYLVEAPELINQPLTIGSTRRNANLIQLTYNGRRLYTFNKDRKPGDIFGNGLGNDWHVVVVPYLENQ